MSHEAEEILRADLTSWEIGPYHGALPAAMKLRLQLDGEVIVAAAVETGFLHRGLEKSLELHFWRSAIAYSDHLDPESAVFGELAICQAVEELGGIEIPPRAQSIRVILCEMTRISAHLAFIVRMARAVGSETVIHYVLRDREKLLDLFELLSGARFSLNFLRYGGVSTDITEGFIERVLEVCDLIRVRLKEYNDVFTFNHSFLNRTSGVGVLKARWAEQLGMTGPNARASGIGFDVRKAAPYCGYDRLDFEIPLGRGEGGTMGDTHDRFVVRLREIAASMEILKQVADRVPIGDYLNPQIERDFVAPAGESYARIESPRGMLGCHVVSDGGRYPSRIQFNPPTAYSLLCLDKILTGTRVEDLPMVLASLDLGIAEADR